MTDKKSTAVVISLVKKSILLSSTCNSKCSIAMKLATSAIRSKKDKCMAKKHCFKISSMESLCVRSSN